MSAVYVLKLKRGKYYVGKTNDVDRSFFQHMQGQGSSWTQKFEPLRRIETKENATVWDEDVFVKKYMQQYGIDNVRGGSYSQVELSDVQTQMLQQELRTASDACFECGSHDHFARDCPEKYPEKAMEKKLMEMLDICAENIRDIFGVVQDTDLRNFDESVQKFVDENKEFFDKQTKDNWGDQHRNDVVYDVGDLVQYNDRNGTKVSCEVIQVHQGTKNGKPILYTVCFSSGIEKMTVMERLTKEMQPSLEREFNLALDMWGLFCTRHFLSFIRPLHLPTRYFAYDVALESNLNTILKELVAYSYVCDNNNDGENFVEFYEQRLYRKKSHAQEQTTSTSSASFHVPTHTAHQSHNKRKQCLDAAEKRNRKWNSFGGGKRRRK